MTEPQHGRSPRELVKELIDMTVAAKDGEVDLTMAGAAHYFSTYCIHLDHAACQGKCKTCRAPCRCLCHRQEAA